VSQRALRQSQRAGSRARFRLSLRKTVNLILSYGALIAILAFAVFPLLWTFAIAITDRSAPGVSIYNFPASLIPQAVTLNNFIAIINNFGLAKYFLNSIIISGLTVFGTLLISVLAAYPLARLNFPLKNIIFGAIISTLVLPSEINFIVNTLTLKQLHLLGTYWGVALPWVSTAFGIFLVRQAYLAVPDELTDAARIDGASNMQILWRIMVPLSMPSLAALGIFQLVMSWNEYFWPMIELSSAPDKIPLSVAVLRLKGEFVYNPFNIAAGAVAMMVPVLLVFIFAQRLFMRGFEGALK
jgi:putative chitobiose transport system permease protein